MTLFYCKRNICFKYCKSDLCIFYKENAEKLKCDTKMKSLWSISMIHSDGLLGFYEKRPRLKLFRILRPPKINMNYVFGRWSNPICWPSAWPLKLNLEKIISGSTYGWWMDDTWVNTGIIHSDNDLFYPTYLTNSANLLSDLFKYMQRDYPKSRIQ